MFLQFLLKFCHFWWFLKMECAEGTAKLWKIIKYGKNWMKTLLNSPLFLADSGYPKIGFRVLVLSLIFIMCVRLLDEIFDSIDIFFSHQIIFLQDTQVRTFNNGGSIQLIAHSQTLTSNYETSKFVFFPSNYLGTHHIIGTHLIIFCEICLKGRFF